MSNCPFCDSEIENAIFASSENFLAIYNIAPVFPGHSLIIPRNHIESILSLSNIELSEMTLFASKVTQLLLKVFITDGFNWSLQDKEAAGQSIAHLHFHILPRINGDIANPGDWYPLVQNNYGNILDSLYREKLTSTQIKDIVTKLRNEAGISGLFEKV